MAPINAAAPCSTRNSARWCRSPLEDRAEFADLVARHGLVGMRAAHRAVAATAPAIRACSLAANAWPNGAGTRRTVRRLVVGDARDAAPARQPESPTRSATHAPLRCARACSRSWRSMRGRSPRRSSPPARGRGRDPARAGRQRAGRDGVRRSTARLRRGRRAHERPDRRAAAHRVRRFLPAAASATATCSAPARLGDQHPRASRRAARCSRRSSPATTVSRWACNGCQMLSASCATSSPVAAHWPRFPAQPQRTVRGALRPARGRRIAVAVLPRANPNESPAGRRAVQRRRRVRILMPHPERTLRSANLSWRRDWLEASLWMAAFRNARA